MRETKVSIIVPVYNVEKYLIRCISSIGNQTYQNIEIICVNDGSTDNSKSILDQYAEIDNRLRVLHKENGGLSSARNAGLDLVTGDIIMFIDSDDWIEANTVEDIVLAFKDKSIDCVTFGIKAYSEGNISQNLDGMNRYLKLKYEGIVDFNFDRALKTNIHVCNKAFRADKIKDLRFIEGLLYEDIFFMWYNFLHINKMFFLPDIYYHYRVHQGSITESTSAIKSFEKASHHLQNIDSLITALVSEPEVLIKNRLELEILILNNARRELELVEQKESHRVFIQKETLQNHLKLKIHQAEGALYGR